MPPRTTSSERLSSTGDENTRSGKPKKPGPDRAHSERALAAVAIGLYGRCGAVSGGRRASGGKSGFGRAMRKNSTMPPASSESRPATEPRFPGSRSASDLRQRDHDQASVPEHGAIAEIRRAQDTPAQFMRWSNVEQAGLSRRNSPVALIAPEQNVRRLHARHRRDTGASSAFRRSIRTTSMLTTRHGPRVTATGMAQHGGLGALWRSRRLCSREWSGSPDACLESVKIFPIRGRTSRDSMARSRASRSHARRSRPRTRRALCAWRLRAISEQIAAGPSSWSAAVDQLCFGDRHPASDSHFRWQYSRGHLERRYRLGTRSNRSRIRPRHGMRLQSEPIRKSRITDPTYAGWEPIAPGGELCPTSRTSVSWERKWPLKPDFVLEGGNWAALGDQWIARTILACSPPIRDPTRCATSISFGTQVRPRHSEETSPARSWRPCRSAGPKPSARSWSTRRNGPRR